VCAFLVANLKRQKGSHAHGSPARVPSALAAVQGLARVRGVSDWRHCRRRVSMPSSGMLIDLTDFIADHRPPRRPASSLHLKLQSVEVSRPGDLDRALSSVTSEHAPAMPLLPGNPVTFSRRDEIAGFAQRNRLPSMYGLNEYVEARRQWRPADETRFPTGVRIDDHPRPPD
jgi:hypothetical protein